MNDDQWTWLHTVLGIDRPGPADAPVQAAATPAAAAPAAAQPDPVPEPLVFDAEETFANNDSPINTLNSPGSNPGSNPGGNPGSNPGSNTPPPSQPPPSQPPQGNQSPPQPNPTSGSPPVPTPPNPDRQKVETAMTDITRRYKALAEPGKTFEMVAARKAFFDAYLPWRKLYDEADFTAAAGQITEVGAKLKALEDLVATLPAKTQTATVTAGKVNTMKPKDLAKLPVSEKTAMIRELLGAGKPTGDTRKAQIAIYKSMTLDKGFVKADGKRGDAIAKDLKGDKELKTARKGWKTMSEDDKIKAMKKVVVVQSKHFGIPAPEIVIEHKPPSGGLITNGYFDPSDGKLHINMDPKSSVQNFQKAIDLALHENAHNWQSSLVKDLKSGKLKPGDTNYEQAQMFAVNELFPGGYIDGAEDYEAYKKQPLEDHSWNTGPATAKKIMKGI